MVVSQPEDEPVDVGHCGFVSDGDLPYVSPTYSDRTAQTHLGAFVLTDVRREAGDEKRLHVTNPLVAECLFGRVDDPE